MASHATQAIGTGTIHLPGRARELGYLATTAPVGGATTDVVILAMLSDTTDDHAAVERLADIRGEA